MKGYIHSLESFGTVDGPGVRYVVFFQGCPMRCQYCHNPDTWNMEDGTLMDSDEIIANVLRNQSFYKTGGITATGGEPLLQLPFLTELFTKAKEHGIHTCLDTSGIVFKKDDSQTQDSKTQCAIEMQSEVETQPTMETQPAMETQCAIDQLMRVTDLVMLDIKHMDLEAHKKLTGHSNENVFAFAEYLRDLQKPMYIRHVVVPQITFEPEELKALGRYLKDFPNLEKLEVLPYHSMGAVKYENLGIPYVLEGVPQLTKAQAKEAEEIIRNEMGKTIE